MGENHGLTTKTVHTKTEICTHSLCQIYKVCMVLFFKSQSLCSCTHIHKPHFYTRPLLILKQQLFTRASFITAQLLLLAVTMMRGHEHGSIKALLSGHWQHFVHLTVWHCSCSGELHGLHGWLPALHSHMASEMNMERSRDSHRHCSHSSSSGRDDHTSFLLTHHWAKWSV